MNMTSSVSVITVTLNSAATLERTIKSVLAQSQPVDEYLIIDGGSTDGTIEIITRYSEKPGTRVIRSITGRDDGIADAFNKGIGMACGRIIGILNSDDCYEEDTIKQVMTVFDEYPDAGFVFGDLDYMDENGRVVHQVAGTQNVARDIRRQIAPINHPTLFVRAEVYKQYGSYDARFRLSMDHEFVLRLVVCGVRGVHDARIRARMSLGGASDRRWRKALDESRRAFILHGMSPVRAWGYYLFTLVKGLVRRLVDWLLPRRWAACLRARVNPAWRARRRG